MVDKSGENNCNYSHGLIKHGNNIYAKTNKFKILMYNKSAKFNNKTMKELAVESDKAYSTFIEQKNKYGIEYAISQEKKQSGLEYKFEKFLKEQNIEYKKEVVIDKYRADFVIYNIIVELDGLFWHSDKIIEDKFYHKNKRDYYLSKGFQPLFFRENEILQKFDIVKSVFLNKLKRSKQIFGRKCIITDVDKNIGKDFISKNHLMNTTSGEYIGLYYNNELICVIQFLVKSKEIHIQRFCNKIFYSVIGGYSKLLKYIKNKYPLPIVNFVDLRYGNGYHLLDYGFKLVNTDISFMWTNYKDTFHRMKFPNNTGYDYKLRKIWDCGQAKYVLNQEYSNSI